MRVILIRHGEPNYELDCLTQEGRKQACAVAPRLKEERIDRICASTLGRAMETAQPTAELLGMEVTPLTFMRELHWRPVGDEDIPHNGHPWHVADTLVAEEADVTSREYHRYYRGEKLTAYLDRVQSGADNWLAEQGFERTGLYYRCTRENRETIALFAHAGANSAFLARATNIPFPQVCTYLRIGFTGITVLDFPSRPGQIVAPVIEIMNDCRHLPQA